MPGMRHKRYSEQVLPELRCAETGRKARVGMPGLWDNRYYDELLPKLRSEEG